MKAPNCTSSRYIHCSQLAIVASYIAVWHITAEKNGLTFIFDVRDIANYTPDVEKNYSYDYNYSRTLQLATRVYASCPSNVLFCQLMNMFFLVCSYTQHYSVRSLRMPADGRREFLGRSVSYITMQLGLIQCITHSRYELG